MKDAGGKGRRGGLEERVEGARGEKEREEKKKGECKSCWNAQM